MKLTCFKSYDIRGQVGVNLDEAIAQRIGAGFAQVMRPKRVVVGHDSRASSPALHGAVIAGLLAAGVDVIDLGLAGTEEVYFATSHLQAGGGIEVTASHNPIGDNGLKLVGPESRPLSDAEFQAVRRWAESDALPDHGDKGRLRQENLRDGYAQRLVGMIDVSALRPMKILVNAGNGTAGPAFDAITAELHRQGAPLDFIRLHHEPDGRFPHGIPNPLLPENRDQTAIPLRAAGADLGVAWDGDFDRCFFFDETGAFVDGEHVVALLAAACLVDHPGAGIVHDPRVIWNIQAVVERAGGRAIQAKVGHVFMKTAMREEGAVYGGEMSAHHYFSDFMYCDSGMIPWLKVIALMSKRGLHLSELVADMRQAFPSSGEINFRVHDVGAAMTNIAERYEGQALSVDRMDGLGLSFADWRFSLRGSSTESYLRLNVEARGDAGLVRAKVVELKQALAPHLVG